MIKNMTYEKVIEEKKYGSAILQVVEMQKLMGAKSANMAQQLFFMEKEDVKLRFIRAILNGSEVTTEAGAFYYSKGNIETNVEVGGITGVLGKGLKSKLTGETAFNPTYKGSGEVVLEPTTQYLCLYPMDNESIIVDKGMYYCHIGNIKVSPVIQSNISSAIAGGEGLFQTKIEGSGIVGLAIPVPLDEIVVINLENEQCQVDGNFAILRDASINFSVTKSSKTIFGSLAGGEGLLNTFRGSGQLWLAPTSPVYYRLPYGIGVEGGSNNIQR